MPDPYTGVAAALDWQVLLPENWSFVGDNTNSGESRPMVGATSLLSWVWSVIPPSPVNFSYIVSVPPSETVAREVVAMANARLVGPPVKLLARPDPLVLRPSTSVHTADTNGDALLNLFELTRVIALYNTRHGTVRTGCYKLDASGEDGFAADAARGSGSAAPLARYHSADTRGSTPGSPGDGAIGLFELTRVIELYNTRSGTERTGQYHLQMNTEDGFAAGP